MAPAVVVLQLYQSSGDALLEIGIEQELFPVAVWEEKTWWQPGVTVMGGKDSKKRIRKSDVVYSMIISTSLVCLRSSSCYCLTDRCSK